MMIRSLLVVCALLLIQGCASNPPDLKSPCAGADGSPCGERRPINDHWLNKHV